MSQCPQCGAHVGVDRPFCGNCGASLAAPQAPASGNEDVTQIRPAGSNTGPQSGGQPGGQHSAEQPAQQWSAQPPAPQQQPQYPAPQGGQPGYGAPQGQPQQPPYGAPQAQQFGGQHAQPPYGAPQAQQFGGQHRSEEHTSELQSLMRSSYAVFCLKKKN